VKKKSGKKDKKDTVEDALSAFYSDVGKVASAEPSRKTNVEAELGSFYSEITAADPGNLEVDPNAPKEKKPLLTLASKKASVNIQKWAAVAEEDDAPEEEPKPEPVTVTVPTEEEVNQSQVDLSINACLLCQRQFPSLDKLKKHQTVSDLHKVGDF
jgi:hypothetical protein